MIKWTIEDYEVALRKCKDENATLKEQMGQYQSKGLSLMDEIINLQTFSKRLAEMLRKLEWSGKSESRAPMCPVCYAVYPFSVHDNDCSLGNLLKEIKEAK